LPWILIERRVRDSNRGELMDKNGRTLQTMAQTALSEIGAVFSLVTDDAAERTCAEILQARRWGNIGPASHRMT
jgi:hypothetical protein